MSKIDYSVFRYINIFTDLDINIHIGDEKNVKNVVSSQLENYGIITLEQLFIAYDNGLFTDLRKSGHRTIKGLVELLKFKYLNEPLVADGVLNENSSNITNQIHLGLLRLGFTQDEIIELFKGIQTSDCETIFDVIQTYLNNSLKLPKQGSDKHDIVVSNLYHKISLILEYKQQENEMMSSTDTNKRVMSHLKHQIEVLIERRTTIDNHISELKQVLKILEFEGKSK